MVPSWLYIVILLISSIFFRSFWMGIAAGIILDVAYIRWGVSFGAVYTVLGVGGFIVSYVIYNMTRLRDSQEK